MSSDGDVIYGAHQWDSMTFSPVAKALTDERSGLAHYEGDPPPGIEPGWVHGSQQGDGFLPMPSRTGFGWGWIGATPADYNRYFRQSINDKSTIQGAVGAWSFLNGAAKYVDLVGMSLNDALRFSVDHPDALCVLRGFHTFGSWQKKHGGDDSVQPFAVYIRNGGTVSGPPEPWHGSSTGFVVIGALAALAGGLAAVGAGAAGGAAGSSSLITSVAQQLPSTIIGSQGDLSKLPLGIASSFIGSATGGIFGGAGAAATESSGVLGDIATVVKEGASAYGAIEHALNPPTSVSPGTHGASGASFANSPVSGGGSAAASTDNPGTSQVPLMLLAAAAILLLLLVVRA